MVERHTAVTARAVVTGDVVDVVDEQIAVAVVAYATGELADLIELDVPPDDVHAEEACPFYDPNAWGFCQLGQHACEFPECAR